MAVVNSPVGEIFASANLVRYKKGTNERRKKNCADTKSSAIIIDGEMKL